MCNDVIVGAATGIPFVGVDEGGMGVSEGGAGVNVGVGGEANHANVDIICMNTADSAARSNSVWGGVELSAFR